MEKTRKMYVTAEEAAEILGVSTGYAYKIIRGLNEELKEKGYRTICGKDTGRIYEGFPEKKSNIKSVLGTSPHGRGNATSAHRFRALYYREQAGA